MPTYMTLPTVLPVTKAHELGTSSKRGNDLSTGIEARAARTPAGATKCEAFLEPRRARAEKKKETLAGWHPR